MNKCPDFRTLIAILACVASTAAAQPSGTGSGAWMQPPGVHSWGYSTELSCSDAKEAAIVNAELLCYGDGARPDALQCFTFPSLITARVCTVFCTVRCITYPVPKLK
jgi:hypothetical protein